MSTVLDNNGDTGVAILGRALEPDNLDLTPEAARNLLTLKFPKRDLRRMNTLAARARRGTLTARERAEAEQYNLISHMFAYLQANARQVLVNCGIESQRPA